MKKIYTAGLALFLLTACSSEQENASPNAEQNTNVQDETLDLADTLTGSYNGIYIDKYNENSDKVAEQIALFGEDFEQFLKMLQETTLIKEQLEEYPKSDEYYTIIVQGDKDVTNIHIEEEHGEPIVSLPTNDVFPTAPRKATNTNILDSIKALESAETAEE
ncbi:hypothetical protein [Solibacillus sp. FSL K6-1554]|uniref:hypothetical protein n=1 Tax=Solibacillus sp. FSL K6-1554 TaxID=2921472 RepID=UPI0030FBE3DD